jgi:hypothetical protein
MIEAPADEVWTSRLKLTLILLPYWTETAIFSERWQERMGIG